MGLFFLFFFLLFRCISRCDCILHHSHFGIFVNHFINPRPGPCSFHVPGRKKKKAAELRKCAWDVVRSRVCRSASLHRRELCHLIHCKIKYKKREEIDANLHESVKMRSECFPPATCDFVSVQPKEQMTIRRKREGGREEKKHARNLSHGGKKKRKIRTGFVRCCYFAWTVMFRSLQ